MGPTSTSSARPATSWSGWRMGRTMPAWWRLRKSMTPGTSCASIRTSSRTRGSWGAVPNWRSTPTLQYATTNTVDLCPHSLLSVNRTTYHGLASDAAQQPSYPKLVDCAPFRLALFARFFQCPADTFCIEIGAVNRSIRLLAPGLIQAARINAIEPELIDQL